MKHCLICDKPFKPARATNVYCSNTCSGTARRKPDAESSYSAIHMHIRYHNKKSGICVLCGKTAKTEWAKKTESEYTRNIDDYLELCIPCHKRYDFTEQTRENMRKGHTGIKHPSKNQPVRATKDGVSTDYPSVKEAGAALGITPQTISDVLSKHRNSAHGYKFERDISPHAQFQTFPYETA